MEEFLSAARNVTRQRKTLRIDAFGTGVTLLSRQVLRSTQDFAAALRTVAAQVSPGMLSPIRSLLAGLPAGSPPETAQAEEEVDHVGLVLNDFEGLSQDHRNEVAKNLALLWDSFVDEFGGVSAFQAASPLAQQAYLTKLEAVSRRIQTARGTPVAFHYVSVELMRQYVSFLQTGSGDAKAIVLANTVAPLIDQGHRLNSEATTA